MLVVAVQVDRDRPWTTWIIVRVCSTSSSSCRSLQPSKSAMHPCLVRRQDDVLVVCAKCVAVVARVVHALLPHECRNEVLLAENLVAQLSEIVRLRGRRC